MPDFAEAFLVIPADDGTVSALTKTLWPYFFQSILLCREWRGQGHAEVVVPLTGENTDDRKEYRWMIYISIHPHYGGNTCAKDRHIHSISISIHPPHGGNTFLAKRVLVNPAISIHPPHGGNTQHLGV